MVGNIRVYQLSPDSQKQITQVNFLEAHDGKVTCIQYSTPYTPS
jgi:hypothetical protein